MRQGDSLSPSIFIISAELLSNMLNNLRSTAGYKGFYMNCNVPAINHLDFVDDTILFCNGSNNTLRKVLDTLTKYEMVSGQLINQGKSYFSLSPNSSNSAFIRFKGITGTNHHLFPIKYLGCPLIVGRKEISHFSGIVDNVISRIRGWYTKRMSTAGRVILIRHIC